MILRKDHDGINNFSYIPIQRISSQCCFDNLDVELPAGVENVTVVVPIPFKFYLYLYIIITLL